VGSDLVAAPLNCPHKARMLLRYPSQDEKGRVNAIPLRTPAAGIALVAATVQKVQNALRARDDSGFSCWPGTGSDPRLEVLHLEPFFDIKRQENGGLEMGFDGSQEVGLSTERQQSRPQMIEASTFGRPKPQKTFQCNLRLKDGALA
jgi:hypothetical protein